MLNTPRLYPGQRKLNTKYQNETLDNRHSTRILDISHYLASCLRVGTSQPVDFAPEVRFMHRLSLEMESVFDS